MSDLSPLQAYVTVELEEDYDLLVFTAVVQGRECQVAIPATYLRDAGDYPLAHGQLRQAVRTAIKREIGLGVDSSIPIPIPLLSAPGTD